MMINGIPQRLYLMQLSESIVPLGEGRTVQMVCVCYLIETSDGKHILIDSGLPADVPPLPNTPSPLNERNVITQLGELGLRPDDIDLFIATHFDMDHCGYNDLFSNAEHVVQRTHYEIAHSGHPRYANVRGHWDHPSIRYRLIDGDAELLPGLTLLETSGHAPSHQSVLVRLPQTGAVLLAIDAVIMERLFTTERPMTPVDDNHEQLRASTQKLLDVVEREHVALVVFGHDGQQWQRLKKSPQYYD